MPRLTFHVPPDARPASIQALLSAMSRHSDGPLSRQSLLDRMAAFSAAEARPRGEVITLARDLGLIVDEDGGLSGTPRLAALAQSQCAVDLMHGLQYVAWSAVDAAVLTRMWTYCAVMDLLWNEAPVTVDASCKKRLVEEILDRAGRAFNDVPGFDAARTSIGPKSIDGVLCWLRELAPAVTQGSEVVRRQTCPPPLVVLALATVTRAAGIQPGTDFRLTPDHRAFICRCCFLDPQSLDRMLEWTVQTQVRHVRWGTLISTYGRQLVLTETCVGPEDLV